MTNDEGENRRRKGSDALSKESCSATHKTITYPNLPPHQFLAYGCIGGNNSRWLQVASSSPWVMIMLFNFAVVRVLCCQEISSPRIKFCSYHLGLQPIRHKIVVMHSRFKRLNPPPLKCAFANNEHDRMHGTPTVPQIPVILGIYFTPCACPLLNFQTKKNVNFDDELYFSQMACAQATGSGASAC